MYDGTAHMPQYEFPFLAGLNMCAATLYMCTIQVMESVLSLRCPPSSPRVSLFSPSECRKPEKVPVPTHGFLNPSHVARQSLPFSSTGSKSFKLIHSCEMYELTASVFLLLLISKTCRVDHLCRVDSIPVRPVQMV